MLKLLENTEKDFKSTLLLVKNKRKIRQKNYRNSEVIIITKGNSEQLYFKLFMAT